MLKGYFLDNQIFAWICFYCFFFIVICLFAWRFPWFSTCIISSFPDYFWSNYLQYRSLGTWSSCVYSALLLLKSPRFLNWLSLSLLEKPPPFSSFVVPPNFIRDVKGAAFWSPFGARCRLKKDELLFAPFSN